jgi:septum formation protein
MRPIVLASTSPIRRKLLHDAGLAFDAVPPGVDEDPGEIRDPVALARVLSLRKARAVAASRPGAWVIGSDQVARDPETPERQWGKPADPGDHLRLLRAERGRVHELCTGWALVGPEGESAGVERARLRMRADLDDDELAAYVATGEAAGCAGGYAIEGRGIFLFEAIDGDWTTVLGLPLLPVLGALRARGWRFSGASPTRGPVAHGEST